MVKGTSKKELFQELKNIGTLLYLRGENDGLRFTTNLHKPKGKK